MELVGEAEAKEQNIKAARLARRAKQRQSFPDKALLWAALGPGWTATLAGEAGFPVGTSDASSVLERMADDGFVSKHTLAPVLTTDDSGLPTVTTPEDLYAAGEQAIREVIENSTSPTDREQQVNQCIANIAQGLRRVEAGGNALPDRIVKWLELAERAGTYQAKDYLLQRVDEELARNNEAGAVAWIESAFPLERALGAQIALAVRLGGLRVQLYQRRAANEQQLKRFLPRTGQEEVFNQLLRGPDAVWALHYAGSGGVGKTMLVRYLESRVAPQAQAATARVDFDYLNPEYPRTKPALLLTQLGEELRLADKTGQASGHFQSFFDKAQTLHERIAGQASPSGGPSVGDALFTDLLDMFADAVRAVAGRVVLILDTCEELAKMKTDGTPQAAVEVTFEILSRLHDRVPALRVVFCGRRPLASSGAGEWSCVRPGDKQLPARPFLLLHEIRAFAEGEATKYLREIRECPESLAAEVLPHCIEQGYTPLFSLPAGAAGPRYTPFELSLYATWISQTKGLTPDEVRNTNLDQYVRTRIVGRIDNRELASLLPVIASMRVVDEQALAHFTGAAASDARVASLLTELRSQEWAESTFGTAFVMQGAIRRRLLDYYGAHEPVAYHDARNAAADYLEHSLAQQPLREIRVDHLEAALEALQPEPARAAKWWQEFEARILAENAWDWIFLPSLRLLADEHWPDNVLEASHIRASVLATRVAAQIHTEDLSGAQESSRLMEADAGAHPDADEGAHLERIARAIRGEILPAFDPGSRIEDFSAASATGLEWLLETTLSSELERAAEATIPWAGLVRGAAISPEQQAWTRVLAGRLAEIHEAEPGATAFFQEAFGMAALFETQPGQQRWRFWKAPADLCSRIRLEFINWAWPSHANPVQLLWWLRQPAVADIDSDRLASAVLDLEAAVRVPVFDEGMADRVSESRTLFYSNPRVSSVHRRFEPFFARAAEELAWRGDVTEALEELAIHAAQSETAGVTFAETLSADRATARIRTRMRIGGFDIESLEHSQTAEDRALLLASRSLHNQPLVFRPEDSATPGNMHLRWSTAAAANRESAHELLTWAVDAFGGGSVDGSPFEEMSCALDRVEIAELAREYGFHDVFRRRPIPPWVLPNPEEAFIIALRQWSLGLSKVRPAQALVALIGLRRAASIALGTGELLALRLPANSVRMLEFAQWGFRKTKDAAQESLTSICLCLALGRAGLGSQIKKHIPRLRKLCENGGNGLINPAGLKYAEAVAEPDFRPEDRGTPRWRVSWLLRLALVLALSKDSGSPGSCCANVMAVWRRLEQGVQAEALFGEAPGAAASGPVADSFESHPPAVLTIECLDRSEQPTEGLRMRLSSRGIITEIRTPPVTTSYREFPRPAEVASFGDFELLSVDRGAAWVSWEAVLDPTGRKMYSRRVRDANLPVPDLENWVSPGFYTLTQNHAGADLGGSGFGSTQRWKYTYDAESMTKQFDGREGIQVLHVVSDVVNTSGGARLSFRGDSDSRGRLYRAEELIQILPDIRVFVLQLPVGLNDGRRDGVCRDKAACLRSFAAQLQLASHAIVITLPGLAIKEGAGVLERIARGVIDPAPTAAMAIFRELAGARDLLFQTLGSEEKEAGFDICYFG